MIRYLIKNNLKLMVRSKLNILLYVFFPLILIAILSSAFHDLMKQYEEATVCAGYRMEEGVPAELADALSEVAEENGIALVEYPDGDPEEIIRERAYCGFVIFEEDSYTLYQNSDENEMGKVLEYFLHAFYANAAVTRMGADTDTITLHIEHPEYKPAIDSTDYYGIVEIIYFACNSIICGTAVFMNEKKYGIRKRYQVSNVAEWKLYFGKFIPILLAVGIGSVLSAVLSVILLDVHWGDPLLSSGILLICAGAGAAFGIMIYSFFENMVATVILTFGMSWVAGYFGGCFETYMYASHPMAVKLASPVYHVNRALTELSCMGHSDYTVSAILYNGGIILLCSVLAVFAGVLRKRGKA